MNVYQKIANITPDISFDAVLVLSPVNRRYVTGFPSSDGYVILTPQKTVYITDFRYYGAACEAQKNAKISPDIEIRLQDKTLWETIGDILGQGTRTLVEENYVTLEMRDRLSEKLPHTTILGGASRAFGLLRAVKTADELEKIEKAQSITDAAFSYIVPFIADHVGTLTESDVALELEYFMRKNGADGVAFDTIAVSGAKSAMPHGVPENIPLAKGFLTMDFGAKFEGYSSDMTRTVCIGKPDDEMRTLYDTVLDAQKRALDGIHAGITGKQADAIARDYMDACGYKGCFGHSLGHSLGLEIHESPNFSSVNDKAIPCGAVLSVEPGLYLTGKYGVRIEDIVNITDSGCKNLTKSAKELIIL